jgi:hypothetical protein
MNSGRSPFTKHGQLAKRPECDNLDRNLHYRFPYPRDAARDHGVHDLFFSFLPLPSAEVTLSIVSMMPPSEAPRELPRTP